jgi:hypothetical protein
MAKPIKIPAAWVPAVLLQERAEALSKATGISLGEAAEYLEAEARRLALARPFANPPYSGTGKRGKT